MRDLEECESFCFIVNSLACTFSRRLVTFAVVPSALPPGGRYISMDGFGFEVVTLLLLFGKTASFIVKSVRESSFPKCNKRMRTEILLLARESPENQRIGLRYTVQTILEDTHEDKFPEGDGEFFFFSEREARLFRVERACVVAVVSSLALAHIRDSSTMTAD